MFVDFKFLCLTIIVRLTFNLRDRGNNKEDDITEETDEDKLGEETDEDFENEPREKAEEHDDESSSISTFEVMNHISSTASSRVSSNGSWVSSS